jgi:hypothetical protein
MDVVASICSSVVFLLVLLASAAAEGPPREGLRFWLDSSDVDASPETTNPGEGELVGAWRDRIGGLVLEQTDETLQPMMSRLGESGAPALYFAGKQLTTAGLQGEPWFSDLQGSIVVIYSRVGDQEGYSFEVVGMQDSAFLATTTFPAAAAGFAIQSHGGPFDNNYFFDTTAINDGLLHWSVVTSDSTVWEFFTDGAGPAEAGTLAGSNGGDWFGELPSPGHVSVGQCRLGECNGPPHEGHIAEVLIYDHPLSGSERSRCEAYIVSKYASTSVGASFRRGDADASGVLNLTDTIFTLTALFQSGPQPTCPDAADVDDDGMLSLTDAIYSLNHLFRGGRAPPGPGAEVC